MRRGKEDREQRRAEDKKREEEERNRTTEQKQTDKGKSTIAEGKRKRSSHRNRGK